MIALDTETYLIQPGEQIPRLVCVSYAHNRSAGVKVQEQAKRFVFESFESDELLVFHNAAFDLAAFCRAYGRPMWKLVIKALEEGRVFDTAIAEKLLDNMERGRVYPGGYSLGALAEKHLGIALNKSAESWRLRYSELDGVPLDQWPVEAIDYAEEDAVTTLELKLNQEDRKHALGKRDLFDPMAHEVRAAFALNLISAWGLSTDPDRLSRIEEELKTRQDSFRTQLQKGGLLKPNGKKDQKALQALVADHYEYPPLTASGRVSYAAEVLNQMEGNEAAQAYAKYCKIEKNLSFIKKLWNGVDTPIHAYINTLISTGRTSMGSSMQQMPRSGGIRECIIPKSGMEFVDVDYSSAELRTWAQCCYDHSGESAMRDLYVNDVNADPYIGVAGSVLGISRQEALARKSAKDPITLQARQDAKVVVLGLPGGMGVKRLIDSERSKFHKTEGIQGSLLTKDKAEELKSAWRESFPECSSWFRLANTLSNNGEIKFHLGSGMWRGGIGYCDAANGPFQHLSGYGAKKALWELCKACYFYEDHPLFGCRPVHFVHDEIMIEAPVGYGKISQTHLEQIMIDGMRQATPDVPIAVEGKVLERWSK